MRIIALFLTLVAASLSARGQALIQPNDSVLLCGDSITDYKLYTIFVADYLIMCNAAPGVHVAQSGWNDEKADFFVGRIAGTVLPYRPTVVTLNDGMEDGYNTAATPAMLTDYRNAKTAAVDMLKKANVRVIVLTSPKCVDPSRNPYSVLSNQTLGQLAAIDKDVAQKEGVVYCDMFGETTAIQAKAHALFGPTYAFGGGDGVHSSSNGQIAMAYVFLKALGCTGDIGTIKIHLGMQQAEGTPGQKIISCKDGTVTVESSIYPFCFDGNDPNVGDTNTANMTRIIPFNQELNRYLLVVDGLTGDKAKVTWGGVTKEFTKDQLTQGVNLAAEFLKNPFFGQFHAVEAALRPVQDNETQIMHSILFSLPGMEALAPKSADVLKGAAKEAVERDQATFDKARAMMVPVTHTISVVPE